MNKAALFVLGLVSQVHAQEIPFTHWVKGPWASTQPIRIQGRSGGNYRSPLPGPTGAFLITDAGDWNCSGVAIHAIRSTRIPCTQPMNHGILNLRTNTVGPIDLRGIHDCIISSTPNAAGSLATISGSPAFITDVRTSDILIQNLRIEGSFGIVYGQGITLNNLEFGNLDEGPNVQCGNFAAFRCRQVGRIVHRNFMFIECDGAMLQDCIMTDSEIESPLRATYRGIKHGLIYRCDISQDLTGRVGAKAAVTLRQLEEMTVQECHIHNGNLSFESGQNGGVQFCKNFRVIGNVCDQPQLVGKLSESQIFIGMNDSDATLQSNVVFRDAGECISVQGSGIRNIKIIANDLWTSNSGIKCYPPAPSIEIQGNKVHGKGVLIKGELGKVVSR